MEKRTLFVALLVFIAVLGAMAQNISGRLADEDNNPVAFANIVLKQAHNDSLVAGLTSDESGAFSVDVKEGKYILTASAIGYERLTVRCGATALGTLLMPKTTKELDEVVVEGSRVTEEAGRFVVLPDPKEAEVSGRGLTLLDMQQLPGLEVDVAMQNITIDGGTPILQINGKEVPLNRFINVRPEQILRIEYSNDPGIRYLDRNASGIINLVLKESDDGGNVMARIQSAFTTGFVDGYLMAAHHKGKSEFSLQYNLSHRNYKNVPYEMTDSYLAEERTVERYQEMNFPFNYITHNITGEYTYQPNDSTMFVATLRDYIDNNHWFGTGTITETENGTTTQLDMNKQTDRKGNSPTLDLFFTHKMRNRQKIELNMVGQYSQSDYYNNLIYRDSESEWEYPTKVMNNGYAISGEAVYGKQLKKAEVRVGLQYQHNFASNDYVVYETQTEMTKDNTYLYTSIDGNLSDNVMYSLGTGVKLFTVTDGIDTRHYVRNLSTARLFWRINQHWSINANARFIPYLPSLSELSPVLQRVDDVEAIQGNESLRPYNTLNGSLRLRYNNKGWFASVIPSYYRNFSPTVRLYQYDPELDLFVGTPYNTDYYQRFQLKAEVGVKQLFDRLNITLNGKLKKEEAKGEEFYHDNLNFSSGIKAQFVWKQLVVGCDFDFTPEWYLFGEDLSGGEMSQSIYVEYNWKSLNASVVWHCPFNKKGYMYQTSNLSAVHPYTHTNWTTDNGNMVVLSLTWKFNYGKAFNKGQKTLWNGGYDDGMVK